jgi:hypothetical protein
MSAPVDSPPRTISLPDMWELRNCAAATLVKAEEHLQRQLREAGPAELAELFENFSPTRTRGSQWTRSFEPLLERVWAWADDTVIAEVETDFRNRGPMWQAVANSLTKDYGTRVRDRMATASHRSQLPGFTIA